MPFMRCLVVCTLWETIASFSPINAFKRVLLPALGLPKIFTNPDFIITIQVYTLRAERMEEVISPSPVVCTTALEK
jgi:hypothetical protein